MPDPKLPLVDDEAVSVRRDDGTVERVRWDDLVEVRITTLGTETAAEDVRFVLRGADGSSCVVAQRQAPDALLDRLLALPGFDSSALITAVVATGDLDLVCWSLPTGGRS